MNESLKSGLEPVAIDRAARSGSHSRTALVLGGGGSAGNAWLIGIVAGLFDAGVDVTTADLIVGTSAGSTAAAQLTSAAPDDLLTDILSTADQRTRGSGAGARAQGRPITGQMEATGAIIAAAENAADMRRGMGAWALRAEATSSSASQARWHATVAARLPSQSWPERRMLVTAVDARTGEPVVFDREGDVTLADAVAASCSSGFAYGIGDGRYIDGGYRRNENADLAAGYARVLVLSPLGGRTRHPLYWRMQLAAQVDDLRAGGSSVETIVPDEPSLSAFGSNMMDLSTRPPAARAGYEQGRVRAGALAAFWS